MDGFREIASDIRERGEKQIAEAVAGEASARGKTILKQFAEEILVLRKRHHAIADITGGKDSIVAAESAGAAAVVGDGDDCGEIGDGALNPAFGVADVLLEGAKNGGESSAAAECHDANWTDASVQTVFHGGKSRLGARTVSLGVEQFREARIFLQECEVLIVTGVIAILGAELDCDFQILHG